MIYPEGKDFIFTIFDDTDVSTVEYIRPIYDYLSSINIKTTKSVWPLSYDGQCDYTGSHSLEDSSYAEYIRELDVRGFEIGFHGPMMVDSVRERTQLAFDLFFEKLGYYPRIYAPHAANRENLYWGADRFSSMIMRGFYNTLSREERSYYQGHIENSPYFWGDISLKYIDYVRNFTFYGVNLLNIEKKIPYSTAKGKWVKSWFFTMDADNVEEFNNLLCESNQDRLESERGVCILTTHLGKGFVQNGELHQKTKYVLSLLSKRNGWFVPVSTVLDFLKAQQENVSVPIKRSKLFLLELKWFIHSFIRKRYSRTYEKTEVPYLFGDNN